MYRIVFGESAVTLDDDDDAADEGIESQYCRQQNLKTVGKVFTHYKCMLGKWLHGDVPLYYSEPLNLRHLKNKLL